jgi:hypothetical protein
MKAPCKKRSVEGKGKKERGKHDNEDDEMNSAWKDN